MQDINHLLLVAVEDGNVRAIQQLLLRGANVNYKTTDDERAGVLANVTILSFAAGKGKPDAVDFLLKSGADPNFGDYPPLSEAATHGHTQIVERLLADASVKVNARNIDNFCALHSAAAHGQYGSALALLNAGANPNALADRGGITPLQMSAYKGHARIVQLLLDRGADPNAADIYGNIPRKLAQEMGRAEVLKILEVAISKPDAKRDSGWWSPKKTEFPSDEVLGQDARRVEWDEDCLKVVFREKCRCGRYFSQQSYNRRPLRAEMLDIIECFCPECKIIKFFSFTPDKIHTTVNKLVQENLKLVRA